MSARLRVVRFDPSRRLTSPRWQLDEALRRIPPAKREKVLEKLVLFIRLCLPFEQRNLGLQSKNIGKPIITIDGNDRPGA